MRSTQFQVQIDVAARSQVVTGPDDLELIIVRTPDGQWRSFTNNCPDEALPLNRPGESRVPLSRTGEIVCVHHVARFDGCDGCLIDIGKAHHARRLAAGLEPVPVEVDGAVARFSIDEGVLEKWRRIQAIRFRKSFGRGVLASMRYWLARCSGQHPAHSK